MQQVLVQVQLQLWTARQLAVLLQPLVLFLQLVLQVAVSAPQQKPERLLLVVLPVLQLLVWLAQRAAQGAQVVQQVRLL